MSNNLDNWLINIERSPKPDDFDLFDVSEHQPRDSKITQFLKSLVEQFLMSPDVVDGLRSRLPESVLSALDAAIPGTKNLRAGVFGEALSAEIYEHWHAFVIPLRKLRFSGGSPPGTDLLALRLNDTDQITEV